MGTYNCTTTINLLTDNFDICGDFGIDLTDMLSTEMSAITTLDEFRYLMSTELINVKHWKTQPNYPTLRLLYDRYLNSTDYCDTISSQFNYSDMIKFSELVGTYWVDLIEQVIPSTTIWGSTYVYGNTIFDQQKFKYKKYSLFGCELPTYSGDVVSPTTGWTDSVQIEWETIPNDIVITGDSTTGTTEVISPFADIVYNGCKPNGQDSDSTPTLDTCIGVGIIQINCGSEFIGRIVDYGKSHDNGGDIVITECSISVEITNLTPSIILKDTWEATATILGDVTGPLLFQWSNGETTQTATNLISGEHYTVTVYDEGVDGCYTTSEIFIQ
jgi:hypothetical protein